MPDNKTVRPDDKTILKTADEVAKSGSAEEFTPSKQFIPYVVVVDGPHAGTRFQLREGENPIGRSVSSVAMLEDQSVSRKHAVLSFTAGSWVLFDAGSKNGTFVNGKKVKDPVTIGHGDVIQVGIYALRLMTKAVSTEEEMAPLPPEAEGKTVMVSAAEKKDAGHVGTDTRTMASEEVIDTGKFEDRELETAGGTESGLEGGEAEGEGLPPEPQEAPEGRRGKLITHGAMAASLLIVIIAGGYAYWRFLGKAPKPVSEPTEPKVASPVTTPAPPSQIPVFLDFASSPLPARVTMGNKDYGLAPVKVNVELEVGKTYEAVGMFQLEDIQDIRNITVSFTVAQDSTTIPILFKAPIGVLKIEKLPRESQIYLEGTYVADPFKPHTAKFSEVVFGKPIYVPFGKYVVELRQPKQIGESNQFIEDIRLKREFQISEESPIYEISVADDDLQKFPVEIRSIPSTADVFIDGQLVGQTPYKGEFPLGEHTMVLRKDGYFEQTQNLKMDINTPYLAEIVLKTTVAGEFINAGNTLMNKGLYKDAVTQFSESFKNSPTLKETAQAQYLLGSCYLHLGDLGTSLGYFEQARQHDDFRYPAMLGLASIYGSQKDTAKALPLLVEVMLKTQDEQVKRDATAVFKQISPLRSVMYIYSDPQGATVIVNDKPMEQKTPLILHDLGLGNYKIRIQKDGYVVQDLNINMSVTEFNPVIIKLKPIEE